MPTYFHLMPLDKTAIRTRLALHPGLLADPRAFVLKHGLPIRTMKPTRGRTAHGPSWNLALDVLTYKGIKVKFTKIADDPLATATIDFNPGACLYGHNGRIISLTGFLHALSLLTNSLTPLLQDPQDWVDLVPGLRPGGHAYWSFLEVLLQCLDPDGALLAGFRHLRHPSITTPTRPWLTSIQAGGARSKLQLAIYRKAVEMVAHGKLPESSPPDFHDVLRLEARMRDKKLTHYFGNERNVEVIEGTDRLVRFYPRELVHGHRRCFSELEGVYSSRDASDGGATSNPLAALGQLLAQVALDPRTLRSFPELLSHLRFYTGSSSDTNGRNKAAVTIPDIRKAGLEELSRRSPISVDDLLSDARYGSAHGIASEAPEQKVCHEIGDMIAHPLITSAYQPPGQPFRPVTLWPQYARL